MSKYFFKFTVTDNVEWLEQASSAEALSYIETRYGKSWRNLGQIFEYKAIAA